MFNLRRREFITLLGVRGGNVAALGVRFFATAGGLISYGVDSQVAPRI